MGFQFREAIIQAVHLHDLLTQSADAQIVCERHVGVLRSLLELRFHLGSHSGSDDLCFLLHSCSFLPFRGRGAGALHRRMRPVYMLPLKLLVENLLGLSTKYHTLSRNNTVLGLTSCGEVGVPIYDDPEHPEYFFWDGKTLLISINSSKRLMASFCPPTSRESSNFRISEMFFSV